LSHPLSPLSLPSLSLLPLSLLPLSLLPHSPSPPLLLSFPLSLLPSISLSPPLSLSLFLSSDLPSFMSWSFIAVLHVHSKCCPVPILCVSYDRNANVGYCEPWIMSLECSASVAVHIHVLGHYWRALI